jgi:soluble lytic murein transglycosylase-like protein
MRELHGDLRLVAAAYNAGDRWVGKKQLPYRNSNVFVYVELVRRHYEQRIAAHPWGGHP